jgi:membrane protein YqaA with SNARE-associated domain
VLDPAFENLGLWGLFASSFLSATLLPGNSEVVMVALLQQAPHLAWPAIVVATAGNTLGGLSSYLVGRFFPQPTPNRGFDWLSRYGPVALLLSWVPLVGDGLCVASGWLRHNVLAAALFIAIGKFARYWALAEGLAWFRV